MQKQRKILASVLIGLALALLPMQAPAEEERRDVLILVNSENDQVQALAMTTASQLAQREHSVNIILCGEAAELGLEEYIPQTLAPRDVSSKELMLEAMSFGATVEVCHLYLPNSGYRQYEEEDLLDDVTVNDPAEKAEMISRDDLRVLSY